MALTLGALAKQIGGTLHNAGPDSEISSVATLQHAAGGDVSFLANKGYRKHLLSTRAGAVILAPDDLEDCPVAAIVTDNPYVAYARAAALLAPRKPKQQGIHPAATIGNDCRIDPVAWIGPHCIVEDGVTIGAGVQIAGGSYIGSGCTIGADCSISANVVICHGVTIGARVNIAPGAVIGSDGFGLASEDGKWINVPQLGSVRIGDDVDIGANTTIDRGALEDTVLEEGVRLDNQIQVAHNVYIGAHTAIAGCVGISGSARIGKHCMIGGGAGIVGHLEIADNVIITGMTMVTRSISRPGVYSSGVPAQENDSWNRNYARLRQLDKLARKVQRLERSLGPGKTQDPA